MARVTVEDCVTIIPNRFELVLLASQRARDISAGMPLTVPHDNDKNPVIALREVADQTIDFEELRRHIVHGVNRHADLNFEDDNITTLTEEALSELGNMGEGIQEVEFESTEGDALGDDFDDEDSEVELEAEASEADYSGEDVDLAAGHFELDEAYSEEEDFRS